MIPIPVNMDGISSNVSSETGEGMDPMTKRSTPWFLLAMLGIALMTGCVSRKVAVPDLVENSVVLDNGEPSHITVQHVLIGFDGSVQGKSVTRSQAEAEALANELLQRARDGANFDRLVKEYTDDSAPGIYHLANRGQASLIHSAKPDESVSPRHMMVPAFGDVGFPLQVGDVGLAEYNPQSSPFGWHIIKRLR